MTLYVKKAFFIYQGKKENTTKEQNDKNTKELNNKTTKKSFYQQES
jgi:hypothetical protein